MSQRWKKSKVIWDHFKWRSHNKTILVQIIVIIITEICIYLLPCLNYVDNVQKCAANVKCIQTIQDKVYLLYDTQLYKLTIDY